MSGESSRVPSITPLELKALLDRGEPVFLLDVREADEREICSIGGELISSRVLLQHTDRIPRDRKVVVYCHGGGRSSRAVEALQRLGFTNLLNLTGGITRWADEVDPKLPKY